MCGWTCPPSPSGDDATCSTGDLQRRPTHWLTVRTISSENDRLLSLSASWAAPRRFSSSGSVHVCDRDRSDKCDEPELGRGKRVLQRLPSKLKRPREAHLFVAFYLRSPIRGRPAFVRCRWQNPDRPRPASPRGRRQMFAVIPTRKGKLRRFCVRTST